MKILGLFFKNINSLKGEHHIDFTQAPFDTSPLFAITGPTGSGKSTLLDVISLALFNQVPRLGKISKKEILAKGAILTRNQKEAFANVTYHCNDGIFTSRWSISMNSKNRLRDYQMEIADQEGNILDVSRSRVPGQNEQHIGLNYDQFIKSVLLAQGEFAQFLKAKKEERGALLEKITGTGIYRDLGKKAFERYKIKARKIEKQQDEIETHVSELLEETTLKQATEQFEEKKKQTLELEGRIKQLEKGIDLKVALAKTKSELESTQEKQTSEKEKMSAFLAQSGTLLSAHEKVRPVADELRAWSSIQKNLSELEKRSAELLETKESNRKGVDILLSETAKFTGKKTGREEAEKQIDAFSEEIRGLQKKMEEKRGTYNQILSIVKEQARETGFEFSRDTDNIEILERLQSDSKKSVEQFSRLLEVKVTADLSSYRESLNDKQRCSLQLEKEEIALKQERKTLNRLEDEAKQVSVQQKTLPKEIELAETKAKQFEAEVKSFQKSIEIQRLRASLEEHRKKLKKDEPCPLCGSPNHPFADHLPKNETTESELDRLQKESKKWQALFISTTSNLAKLKEREEELHLTIASVTKEIESLAKQEKALAKDLYLEPGTSWEDYSLSNQKKLEVLTKLENQRKVLASYREIRPNLKKLSTITKEGKGIKTQLNRQYSGENINSDAQNLLQRWSALNREGQLVNDQLKAVEVKIKAKRKENQFLEASLDQADNLQEFNTVEQAHKCLLDERTFDQLQTEKTEIKTALNRLDTTIKLLQKQLDESQKLDFEESLKLMEERLEAGEKELTAIREKRNELERRLNNHHEKVKKIDSLKQQIATEEKQIKRWKLLNELIGDAKGKRFNDFAQDLTLSHLVVLANLRLAELSDRYRLAAPNETDDDSLIILDDHMGSQRRSVRTLSGGETFLLSLSMALALSDLASSSVEINSLFIDEGFGTLDPETLDQTLDTLEKLQSESSKTIGIISHVDSLKERIATQIQLERNGQGYSTLRII